MKKWALGILAFSLVASANSISFTTTGSPTDTAGEAVSASGSVTTNANGTVTVTLTNNQANPKSAGQLLSDLFFTLNLVTAPALSGTTTPTIGSLIAIDDSGNATPSAAALVGWTLSSNADIIHLDSLAGGPSQTIIGPGGAGGVYTNANSSIAKTGGPHNPFLTGTVTFNFAVAGVTATTGISAPVFSFGTAAGDNITGCIVGGPSCTSITTPEPLTLGLTGAGLIGLFFIRRRRPTSL